jgi:hypothetical protein
MATHPPTAANLTRDTCPSENGARSPQVRWIGAAREFIRRRGYVIKHPIHRSLVALISLPRLCKKTRVLGQRHPVRFSPIGRPHSPVICLARPIVV